MGEGGANGALGIHGLGLDVDRHGLCVAKGQRGRASGDQLDIQARLQAMILPDMETCKTQWA